MATEITAKDWTVVLLKEKLKSLGLQTYGSKAELISRLDEYDPSSAWVQTLDEVRREMTSSENNVSEAETSSSWQIEMYKREKELAERELNLARREIELLREMQRVSVRDVDRRVGPESGAIAQSRINVAAIADLLSVYDGTMGDFENWERQLKLLKQTYKLNDEYVKVLIGMRLKGKTLEWLHSRAEYIEMSVEDLLSELKKMFHHRPTKIVLRKKFEDRSWKKGETFHEYVHEKTILANRIQIDDDEIVDYIIDGIPDIRLKDQARVSGLRTKSSLLAAFEDVTLPEKNTYFKYTETRDKFRNRQKDEKDDKGKRNEQREAVSTRRRYCFNCGQPDHQGRDCPTKDSGPKCFQCGERGHIAAKCGKKEETVKKSCVASLTQAKYNKEVAINGNKIVALIDTGSDICLMRADEYIKVGSPKLERKEIRFRGIGLRENVTLGEFHAEITVDQNSYPILIRVVSDDLLSHKFLIGTDFLNSVEINIKNGNIAINPINEIVDDSYNTPEIFQIDLDVEINDQPDLSNVSNDEYQTEIKNIIANYHPCETKDVGVKMSIILKDDEPVYQRARRLSPSEREKVNMHISEWMRDGIVRPSLSDYASPVVLTSKKDGNTRLCVDFRQLNKKIIRDRYPLPLIEDQLDLLQNAKFFSTLDLKNGFFHVPIDEHSQKYTAFIVPDGHYEFLKVPFGLCNSPAIFQRFINIVFKDLIRDKIVLTYMDDLIIPSENVEVGMKNLKTVLNIASEAGLIINWQKCCFLRNKVEFLGHIVENGRVYPSTRKIDAVRKFPEPKNAKQVQSFLGLSGYFRKFVPQYSIIARPLTNLLKADVKFQFGEKEQESFTRLKEILCDAPVLSLYRPGAETELHTDASAHGYGAILLQKGQDESIFHPVYYSSGKTTPAEQRYTSYELEVLAIIKALCKFRVYLLGIPFKIVTDCRAFTLTMHKKDLCIRVARWALLLEEFNYTIEHRPGKSMVHVDALSRNPLPVCMIVDKSDSMTARFEKAQQADNDIKKMFDLVKMKEVNNFAIKNNLLFKEVNNEFLLVVPKSMQTQIIKQAHERGHFSIAKTEALILKDYWIPNVKPKIEKIIKNCVSCILADKKRGKLEGYLYAIDKGEVPLDTFHIDHLGPLPSTKKSYKHIFVVIDAFTKYVWLYATRSTDAAEVVNRLKKQSILFGNPRRIISDRGTAFTSKDFEDYCNTEKITHVLTTTGIPRANGQVERVNRILISLLTKLSHPKREEWFKFLDLAQQCINCTIQRSIGTTPFHLLFGTHARVRDDPTVRELLEQEWVESFQDDRNELREQAKECIAKIQRENRAIYNKKRKRATKYEEDDLVAIRRTQQAPGLKLANKYLGPYVVSKVLRNDRYIVNRVGEHEGPLKTSTAADSMKRWVDLESDMSDEEECDDNIRGRMFEQDGRV